MRMTIKALLLGAVALIGSAVAFANGVPNLDGPGSLPTDPEVGQCYLHKFYPPKYVHEEIDVMVKEGYTFYTEVPAEWTIELVNVPMVDAYTKFEIKPPVFDHETIKIEIKPSDPVWHVKCCKKDHKHTNKCHSRCDGPGHGKKKACEQACFKPVKPIYKAIRKQITVSDGTYIELPQAEQYQIVATQDLVKDAYVEATQVPPEFMKVKVYTLEHPGYMKWVKGTCKKYTCNPRHLQQALKDKGYYKGSIDGIIGQQTIGALNDFRKDNNLGMHDEIDKETADALGIK